MNEAIEKIKQMLDDGEQEFEFDGTCPWCEETIELYLDAQEEEGGVYISAGGDCECDRYDYVEFDDFKKALESDEAFSKLFDIDATKDITLFLHTDSDWLKEGV